MRFPYILLLIVIFLNFIIFFGSGQEYLREIYVSVSGVDPLILFFLLLSLLIIFAALGFWWAGTQKYGF